MKLLFTSTAILVFAWCAFGQTTGETSPALDDVYLAKDDGKGKAGEEAGDFVTSDVPIYCVVMLDTPGVVNVKMNFVAVKVAGVKADTKVVTATFTTKENQNRVNFTGRPHEQWVPGRYRVDIFLNGKIARGLEFEIKAPIDRTLAGKPAKKAESATTEPIKANRKP